MKRDCSMRTLLLLYFTGMIVVNSVVLTVYYSYHLKKQFEANVADYSQQICAKLMANIDANVKELNQFFYWMNTDNRVMELLERDQGRAKQFDRLNLAVIQSINKQRAYLPVSQHIGDIFILGNNGIDLRNGSTASAAEVTAFPGHSWFDDTQFHQTFWGALQPIPLAVGAERYAVPVSASLGSYSGKNTLGQCIVLLNPSFFDGQLTHSELLFVLNERDEIVYSNSPDYPYGDLFRLAEGRERHILDEDYYYTTVCPSLQNGWRTMLVTPISVSEEAFLPVRGMSVLALALTVFTGFWIAYFLSKYYTRPIASLVMQVNDIAGYDFQSRVQVSAYREMRELCSSINRMSGRIDALIRETQRQEKEKRDMEFSMLQNQINPHFLLNTLNTIKWMALLQNQTPIGDAIGLLGRLLKRNLKITDQKVPSGEEIENLQLYLEIQRMRYFGKIAYEVAVSQQGTQELLVPKFILQPLVENSILHGIKPLSRPGEIKISLCREGEWLKIEIEDNGMGIPPEKLEGLQDCIRSGCPSSSGKSIGIINVYRRLKLLYEDRYQFTISSEEGRYTKTTILLPAERCAPREEQR